MFWGGGVGGNVSLGRERAQLRTSRIVMIQGTSSPNSRVTDDFGLGKSSSWKKEELKLVGPAAPP